MTNDENANLAEHPEKVIDETLMYLDSMHETLIGAAVQVGYTRDTLKSMRPHWQKLADSNTTDESTVENYSSALKGLMGFRDEVRSRYDMVAPLSEMMLSTAGSAGTAYYATGTTAAFFSHTEARIAPSEVFSPFTGFPDLPTFAAPENHEAYARRFAKLDPALGKTYQEISEALYGTRSDPERAALYLIRQSFDHLFDRLAPDSEVRASTFWTKKSGPGEEQVWREERIHYAINKHVSDTVAAKTLLANTDHMIVIYKALNRAHSRNELDREKARSALNEMLAILQQWANALALP